ncbi:conserved hypothetical protein [Ricinus communis]|uniref:Uncharacterized protein n=1 Tax=Ricinus communis TaxID=3988 RepID=B9RKL4_RICCO|nr:conserved hypothetical protein [Ricinus communis]
MGALLKRAKKVAEAERLSKKGTEYCQNKSRLNMLLSKDRSLFLLSFGDGGEWTFWSHSRAPRRINALVDPQIRPTATIFSISLAIRDLLQVIPGSGVVIVFVEDACK